jgi:hypothetical protein
MKGVAGGLKRLGVSFDIIVLPLRRAGVIHHPEEGGRLDARSPRQTEAGRVHALLADEAFATRGAVIASCESSRPRRCATGG